MNPTHDDTREACRRLLGAPKPRAARCRYCGERADTGGPITLALQGWDLKPGPQGVRWWRCPACRAEEEAHRKDREAGIWLLAPPRVVPTPAVRIPVRIEPSRRERLWEAATDLLFLLWLLVPILASCLILRVLWRP
jgi:hypothetical protein